MGSAPTAGIAPHLAEVFAPQARTGQREDLPGLVARDELLQRTIDGARVGLFAREARCLFEDVLAKHKTCTLHVYKVTLAPLSRNRCWRELRGAHAVPSPTSMDDPGEGGREGGWFSSCAAPPIGHQRGQPQHAQDSRDDSSPNADGRRRPSTRSGWMRGVLRRALRFGRRDGRQTRRIATVARQARALRNNA